MIPVAYSSPFVPAEWIAAHGAQPVWLHRLMKNRRPGMLARRGGCYYADALVTRVLSESDVAAVVMTTRCDQMRYAAAFGSAGRNREK